MIKLIITRYTQTLSATFLAICMLSTFLATTVLAQPLNFNEQNDKKQTFRPHFSPNDDNQNDQLIIPLYITAIDKLLECEVTLYQQEKKSNKKVPIQTLYHQTHFEPQKHLLGIFNELFKPRQTTANTTTQPLELPSQLVWNGKINEKLAEDGIYYLQIKTIDLYYNQNTTPFIPIYLDTKTPKISYRLLFKQANKDNIVPMATALWHINTATQQQNLALHKKSKKHPPPQVLFANLSKIKPNASFLHLSLKETHGNDAVNLLITKKDKHTRDVIVVQKFKWKASFVQQHPYFVWDGLDLAGNVATDGWYKIELSAIDKAGNSFVGDGNIIRLQRESEYIAMPQSNISKPAAPLLMETVKKPLTPSHHYRLNVQSHHKVFSPNGDGKQDSTTFFIEHNFDTNMLLGFTLHITDSKKRFVYKKQLTSTSKSIVWRGDDYKKRIAPDGLYFYKMIANLQAERTTVDSLSKPITIDTKPLLRIALRVKQAIARPFTSQQKVLITQHITQGSMNDVVKIRFKVVDDNGNIYEQGSWINKLPKLVQWRGVDKNGQPYQKGKYRYHLQSIDKAGNTKVYKSQFFYLKH